MSVLELEARRVILTNVFRANVSREDIAKDEDVFNLLDYGVSGVRA